LPSAPCRCSYARQSWEHPSWEKIFPELPSVIAKSTRQRPLCRQPLSAKEATFCFIFSFHIDKYIYIYIHIHIYIYIHTVALIYTLGVEYYSTPNSNY
jgi:hypothetical protein